MKRVNERMNLKVFDFQWIVTRESFIVLYMEKDLKRFFSIDNQ